jgi:signal transduction histidine kinase
MDGEPARMLQRAFPGGLGRWGMRRSSFRQGGLPHQLLVLADLSKALREEERQAWQRLLRVLGHELNNSLAPIKSIGTSLANLLAKDPPPTDWKDDMRSGLAVISARADTLSRFMEAYSRLARLPQPRLQALAVGPLIRRVANLETRIRVEVQPGAEVTVKADGDQLEQLLINLLRNAVDAALETKGRVWVGWRKLAPHLEIVVEDEGPGLSNTANLFVPFFTTKDQGTGLGLAISQSIVQNAGGSIQVQSQPGAGSKFTITLPASTGVLAPSPTIPPAPGGGSDPLLGTTPSSEPSATDAS